MNYTFLAFTRITFNHWNNDLVATKQIGRMCIQTMSSKNVTTKNRDELPMQKNKRFFSFGQTLHFFFDRV
jgi:hypothetical protein